jgi:hypothetical protein
MFNIRIPSSIEWQHPLPPADHRYDDTPILTSY